MMQQSKFSSIFKNTVFLMTHSGVLGAVVLVTLAGCQRPGQGAASGTRDVVGVTPDQLQPSLGAPYDSLTQIAKDSVACVQGKTVKTTAGTSDVSLSQSSQGSSAMKEITGEVKGTPRILFTQPQTALGFFRSSNNAKTATEITYTAKILQETEKLELVSLIPELLKSSGLELFGRCGDEYIGQINRGGLLNISLKLDFGSEQNRQKWQALFAISGRLGDFSKDLKRKSEQNQLQGMLTIQVHQIGGSPNQALLSAKTCSMSNQEELAQCIKTVDQLIDYAANSFPAQIESNPAVLQYITVPLHTLGSADLPRLDPQVLLIRKDFEGRLQTFSGLSEALKLGSSKGLKEDASLEAALDYNIALTKTVAQACYQYKLASNIPAENGLASQGLSWEDCQARYQSYQGQLKSVQATAAKVNQLEVSAQEPMGDMIVNQTSTKMTIVYAVDPMSRWSFGTKEAVGLQSTVSCSSACAFPSAPKGALLVQSSSGTERVKLGQGTLEIYPGEAAYFFMNDEKTRYIDNSGGMTVFWRCLDCMDQSLSRPLSKIMVDAKDPMGTTWVHRGQTPGTYTVTSYGQWTNAVGKYPWSDARGLSEICGSTCPLPSANSQLLVGQKSDGSSVAIGIRQQLTLNPGETISFKVNDDQNGYRDNGGQLVVYLQCLDCSL